MTYKYGRNQDGAIIKRKARCSMRGYTMRPDVHYDPAHSVAYAVDKSTIRTIYALAAAIHYYISTSFSPSPQTPTLT